MTNPDPKQPFNPETALREDYSPERAADDRLWAEIAAEEQRQVDRDRHTSYPSGVY